MWQKQIHEHHIIYKLFNTFYMFDIDVQTILGGSIFIASIITLHTAVCQELSIFGNFQNLGTARTMVT